MTIDHNARYWAYSNYLIALSHLIRGEHPTDNDLAQTVSGLAGYIRIKRRTDVNIEEVAKLLRQSWFTELLLLETYKYQALLPYAVPWSMIQCYYAVYSSIRAYFLATGRDIENAHEKTLRQISEDLINYKERFPHPWRCVIDGDPKISPLLIANSPCSSEVILKNALVSPYSVAPCLHYGLFLKTTRTRQLERLALDWKRRNKVLRLPRGGYLDIVNRLHPTTIFDTFYRIRTRSNYQDIDSFTFSNATVEDSTDLQRAICNIVYYTLLVFELMIARSIGKKLIEKVVDEFVKTPLGKPASETALKRWLVVAGV